jgi:hypothetical protein
VQHLRIGSVINWVSPSGQVTVSGATVTNITDAYIEYETDTDPVVSHVRPWAQTGRVEVVTD